MHEREHFLRGARVLAVDDAARLLLERVRDVARDHPDVDALAHGPGLSFARMLVAHPDLLRPDRDAPAVALDDVRDADKAGDELRLRVLVDVRRRTDLLDPAIVEDGEPV